MKEAHDLLVLRAARAFKYDRTNKIDKKERRFPITIERPKCY